MASIVTGVSSRVLFAAGARPRVAGFHGEKNKQGGRNFRAFFALGGDPAARRWI